MVGLALQCFGLGSFFTKNSQSNTGWWWTRAVLYLWGADSFFSAWKLFIANLETDSDMKHWDLVEYNSINSMLGYFITRQMFVSFIWMTKIFFLELQHQPDKTSRICWVTRLINIKRDQVLTYLELAYLILVMTLCSIKLLIFLL